MTKSIAATGAIAAMLMLTATRANGGGVLHNRHARTTLRPDLPLQLGDRPVSTPLPHTCLLPPNRLGLAARY